MSNRISDDEIQKFLQGCEDFIRLGNSFSQHIREAFEELKNTYEPVAKSNYVDKAIGDLLEKSLKEFESKMTANLQGIEKICTKGSQWFAYYLGRRKESDLVADIQDKVSQAPPDTTDSYILKNKEQDL
jgi:hypothetical protein